MAVTYKSAFAVTAVQFLIVTVLQLHASKSKKIIAKKR